MKPWEQRLGRLLIALRLDSIRSKIIALAVVATLAPALSTAILSYVANRRALTDSLRGELQGIGSQTAREVDLWSKELVYDVRVFVSSFEVSENLDRLPLGGARAAEARNRLNNYLTSVQAQLRYQGYAELLVADADGRPVASSRPSLRQVDVPDDWLPRLRRGETVMGEPYLDEVLDSVAVTIGQPIVSAGNGGYVGVLVATLTFGAVRDVLEGLAPGVGGRVELVMGDGRRIVGSGRTARLEPALPVGVLAGLRAEPGGTMEYARRDEEPVLGALTTVPRRDWSVLTEIPSEEAYAQVTRLRNSAAGILTGVLLFVGLAAYLLGLFIVRPLDRLAAGARAVSAGDLTVDLPVSGGGEVGYLTKVFNRMVGQLRRSREELSNANAALREHNVELERLSITDALTGLYNRRYVMNELDKEVARAERHDRVLSVLMLDVDRFKDYNDAHGHLAGDQVLTGMGRVLEDATRDHDVPGRFGGEEFIALLPDCDLPGAVDAAERIRRRLTEEVFEGGSVTCSIGAAAYPGHGATPHALIAAADAALYQAKERGRDRVVAATAAGRPEGGRVDPATKRRTPEQRRAATAVAPPARADSGAAAAGAARPARAEKRAAASASPGTDPTERAAASASPEPASAEDPAASAPPAPAEPASSSARKPARKRASPEGAGSEGSRGGANGSRAPRKKAAAGKAGRKGGKGKPGAKAGRAPDPDAEPS